MKIESNVFVVTGGASGLGAATSQMLREGGGNVVIADVNPPPEGWVGPHVRYVMADVTDESSARSVFAEACAMGTLRGLINCAGVAPAQKVLGRDGIHSLDAFARTVSINLVGTFNMIRLASEIMSQTDALDEDERGVIINTASVAAFEGQIGQVAYAASKGGVAAMTLPLARELSRSGIRVMTIAPGIMETPMLLGMPQDVQDALGSMVPFPSRLGKASEYAALVAHILDNRYLNGEVIRLDAAIRMAAR